MVRGSFEKKHLKGWLSMNKKTVGVIQMIVCAVLWSIGGIIIKLIDCGPFMIAGVRSFFAAVCMAVFMLAAKIKFKINKRVLVSSFFTALMFICFVLANKLTYAANAIVLQFTEPIFFLIFSAIIFKERLKARDVAVALATLVGVAMFFAESVSGDRMLGNFVAIGAGISLAFVYIISGRVSDEERMSGMLIGHLLTAAFGIFMFCLYPMPVTVKDMALMAVLGIFQLGIPYVLYCLALGKCSSFACSLIGAIEPMLNPVWVMLFDGETPGIFALFGSVIVIAAVTIWSVAESKNEKTA